MAIDKAVVNEYGAEFTYHKLRDVRIVNDDRIGVQLTLTVYSWLNKKARIDGKEPTVRQCIISNADFAMTPFYALLKAKFPDFKAGKDDFNNDFKAAADGAQTAGDESKKAASTFSVQTAQGRLLSRFIKDDELVEVTPHAVRMCKKILDSQKRRIMENRGYIPECLT